MDNIIIFIEKYDKNIKKTKYADLYLWKRSQNSRMFWSIYHIVESTLKKFENKICFYIYYKYIEGFKC